MNTHLTPGQPRVELDHGGVDVSHGAREQEVGEHFHLAALDVHLHDDGWRTSR